jgi:hypothetical protein
MHRDESQVRDNRPNDKTPASLLPARSQPDIIALAILGEWNRTGIISSVEAASHLTLGLHQLP